MKRQIKTVRYLGCEISQNWASIRGTGKPMRWPKGWNVTVPDYGFLCWEPSMRSAKSTLDNLLINGNSFVKRALRAAIAKGNGDTACRNCGGATFTLDAPRCPACRGTGVASSTPL